MNRIGAARTRPARLRLVLGGLLAATAVAAAIVLALRPWARGGAPAAMPALGPGARPAGRRGRTQVTPVGPLAVTAAGLRDAAGSLGGPVYWVGPLPGRRYELRRTTDGDVFVRYLPAGAAPGDPHAYTTVAVYPLAGAYPATQELAGRSGSASEHVEGWLAVFDTPTTVYLAAPGFPYQIELYDPSASEARGLVESGAVGPVP